MKLYQDHISPAPCDFVWWSHCFQKFFHSLKVFQCFSWDPPDLTVWIHSQMPIQRHSAPGSVLWFSAPFYWAVAHGFLLCSAGRLCVVQIPVLCVPSGIQKRCQLFCDRMWALRTVPAPELLPPSIPKGGAETGESEWLADVIGDPSFPAELP